MDWQKKTVNQLRKEYLETLRWFYLLPENERWKHAKELDLAKNKLLVAIEEQKLFKGSKNPMDAKVVVMLNEITAAGWKVFPETWLGKKFWAARHGSDRVDHLGAQTKEEAIIIVYEDLMGENPVKIRESGTFKDGGYYRYYFVRKDGSVHKSHFKYSTVAKAEAMLAGHLEQLYIQKNPRRGRTKFKPPFTVYTHFERGEARISVDDRGGHEVASWDTEGVEDMVESGYFDTSGFIMGREVRRGRLEQSVLNYLFEMKVIPSVEMAN